MAWARFKDLCLDAVRPEVMGPFWAAVLGRHWEPDGDGVGRVVGPTGGHTVWINRVPEAKSVKHRVHLDVYTTALGDLEALGSAVVRAQGDGRTWTVMADPEGGEYCAFLRPERPAERLHALVVDCPDPAALACWWADVYGARLIHHPQGYSTVVDVPGMPIATMDFVPVPESKAVKNRIHWQVTGARAADLVTAGARLVRPPGEGRRWHVMADPAGNEFCAFEAGAGGGG